MKEYHDNEWGVPEHNDQILFEFLILEGMQAGLSWSTSLNKRDNFKKAFDNFDFNKIAKYDDKKVEILLENKGIIRNRLKIKSAITNAKSFLKVRDEFGSFDKYLWSYVDNKPINNGWKQLQEIPANTELSDIISKDLKKRGFKFIGTTIVYAYMQSIGLVNDHLISCYKYKELLNL